MFHIVSTLEWDGPDSRTLCKEQSPSALIVHCPSISSSPLHAHQSVLLQLVRGAVQWRTKKRHQITMLLTLDNGIMGVSTPMFPRT